MFEIETESLMVRTVGEGPRIHLDIDALLPRAVAHQIVTLILEAQKAEAESVASAHFPAPRLVS
jgi:hypothetical protein